MKRKHRRWLLALTLFIVLAGSCVAYCTWPGGGVPSTTWDVLDRADEWELYSLFPDTRNTELSERFGDWPVLGKTTVRDPAVRERLRRALAAATPRYEAFNGANCFWPRHGVRATHAGRTVELAICFECQHIYQGDGEHSGVSPDAQPVFDAVLRDAGVRLAPPGPPWTLKVADAK
jgi:hypothetical protein